MTFDAAGNAVCPEPPGAYVPCCWQAGEIIRARCDDPPADDLRGARRRRRARNFLDAGVRGRLTVPGATVEDWKGCGQCPDCFLPAFNYRPKSSVQYIMALSNFGSDSVRSACASTSASSRRATTTARGPAPATRSTTASRTRRRAARATRPGTTA